MIRVVLRAVEIAVLPTAVLIVVLVLAPKARRARRPRLRPRPPRRRAGLGRWLDRVAGPHRRVAVRRRAPSAEENERLPDSCAWAEVALAQATEFDLHHRLSRSSARSRRGSCSSGAASISTASPSVRANCSAKRRSTSCAPTGSHRGIGRPQDSTASSAASSRAWRRSDDDRGSCRSSAPAFSTRSSARSSASENRLELVLLGLLADGHVLLEDLPASRRRSQRARSPR